MKYNWNYLKIRLDYVFISCVIYRWHFYDTKVLSCEEERMVAATNAHRKDLIEKIEKLKAGGTTELE